MEPYVKPVHYNRCTLCGRVAAAPVPSHTNHGQLFCRFPLSVPRLSGQCDVLNIIAPQTLLDAHPLCEGEWVSLTGQLRSYNNKSGVGPRLIISVLARTLVPSDGEACNVVRLAGTVCKTRRLSSAEPNLQNIPVRTPLGREICDVILAVNRRYGRADYLPCISWGAVAEQTALLDVGAPMALEGRIQSRTYTKSLSGSQTEQRTAYEVSAMTAELV